MSEMEAEAMALRLGLRGPNTRRRSVAKVSQTDEHSQARRESARASLAKLRSERQGQNRRRNRRSVILGSTRHSSISAGVPVAQASTMIIGAGPGVRKSSRVSEPDQSEDKTTLPSIECERKPSDVHVNLSSWRDQMRAKDPRGRRQSAISGNTVKNAKATEALPPLPVPKPRNKSSFKILLSKNQEEELMNYEEITDGTCKKITPRESYFETLTTFESNFRKGTEIRRPKTPSSSFISKCREMSLLPEPLVAKAQQSKDGVLNLSSYGVGDNVAKALSGSLSMIENIVKINLKGNRLSDAGALCILENLNCKTVRELDFSNNAITSKTGLALASFLRDSRCRLTSVTLENNALGDQTACAMSHSLLLGKTLRKLNLSRCNIGTKGALAIGDALSSCMTLSELDLSWNQIRGKGAAALAIGVERCHCLLTLNLAWNTFGSATTPAAIKALAQALEFNEVLTHLDISNNRLLLPDIQALSKALQQNHTLKGLHIEGNVLEPHQYGLVVEDATNHDPDNKHIFTRITDDMKCYQPENPWEKRSNCWICEKWDEHQYTYDPQQDDHEVQEVIFKAEFNYWEPLKMKRNTDRVFEVYCLTPPGKSQYFFVVDSHINVDGSQASQAFKRRVLGGTSNFIRGVKNVNWIEAQPRDDEGSSRFLPRNELAQVVERDWFANSLFSAYAQDTPELLTSAFESDWNLSRLPTICKDVRDTEALKRGLLENFSMLKNIFKHYSSGRGDPFTMGSNSYSDFIHDCFIVDDLTCTRAEVDMLFITSNLSGPKCNANPKRALLRFQFLEVIANLALIKYHRSKLVNSPQEALEKFISENIEPNANFHDAQSYRNGEYARLYTKELAALFKEHLGAVREVFDSYAGSIDKNPSGKKKRMSVAEFTSIMVALSLTDETLASREIRIAILYSKETEINELANSERAKKLNFCEFIEALARIADMKDFAPDYYRMKSEAKNTPELAAIAEVYGVCTSTPSDWSPEGGNLKLKLQVSTLTHCPGQRTLCMLCLRSGSCENLGRLCARAMQK